MIYLFHIIIGANKMLGDEFDKEVEDLINNFSNTSKTFDEKGNKDWTNKIITTMEGKPLLMIHRFKEEYLKLPLDEYVLVFDDGLYNHYLWFRKIRAKFPRVKMIFAVSTNIIANGWDIQDDMESPEAHELYFKHQSKIGFMNMNQIKEISNSRNCFIAVHGHNHMNLDTTRKTLGLLNYFQEVQKEYIGMFDVAMNWIYSGIIRSKLMFVLPYNQYEAIAIASIRNVQSNYDPVAGLVLIGPGRIDIETLKGI